MTKINNSNKSKIVVLTQGETILIQNSHAPKNKDLYGNLYLAVQGYKHITRRDLDENKMFDDKAKATILANKKELMQNVMEEWVYTEHSEISDKKIPCQLCSSPNTFIYYIRNQKTEVELHVGSECIKKFKGIGNIKQISRDKRAANKRLEKEKRKIEFSQIDLEDINFVEEAEQKFKEIDIVLPYELYTNIELSLKNLNYIRTDYVKNGGNFEEVKEKYFELKNNHERLWEKAEEFYLKNKDDSLTCNKFVGNWIKNRNFTIWQKISKNNGKFSVDTLQYINHPSFVESHLEDFKQRIVDKELSIIEVDENATIIFRVENKNYPKGLVFGVGVQWFMRYIGCYCLATEKYRYDKMSLTKISISETEHNISVIFNRINYILHQFGYGIEFETTAKQCYYKQLGKMLKKSRYSNKVVAREEMYIKTSFRCIIDVLINNNLIFSTDDEKIESVFRSRINLLKKKDTWMSKQEKEERERITKELTFSKQKEFVPYV